MNRRVLSRVRRLTLLAVLALAAASLPAAEKSLGSREIKDKIEAYFKADEAGRRAILVELKAADPLERSSEVRKWVKMIVKEAAGAAERMRPRKTDITANLDEKRKKFNQMIGVPKEVPVATVETPEGEMRVVVMAGKARGEAAALIYLHGGGNVGAAHPGHLDNEMAWGWGLVRAKNIRSAPLAFYPRCLDDKATNAWIKDEECRAVSAVLDRILLNFRVDPDRVYLMGQSMGGFGVWNFAAIDADRYAVIADLAGSCTIGGDKFKNFRNVQFGVFMGGKDGRKAGAEKGVRALEALQKEDSDGYAVEYKVYPDQGHGLEGPVYKDLDALFEKTRRNAYPRVVVWHPQVAWKKRFYNIGIDAPAKGMSVRAEMKRDNTVLVTTSGVPALRVYLNEKLADLDKPVTVVWNGKEAFRGAVRQSVAVLLETLGDRGDRGMFYTARVDLSETK